MRHRLWIVVCLLAAAPTVGRSQSSPEAAAQVFANTVKAGDWAATARLMHPEALQQLRSLFGPIVESPRGGAMGVQLFGVRTPAEFASMSDTALFAALLRTVTTRTPELAEALATARTTSLGHVAGGADTVFVVSRTELTMGEVSMTQFEVLPFKRYQGEWRALLKADYTNMAAMLRRAAGARDPDDAN